MSNNVICSLFSKLSVAKPFSYWNVKYIKFKLLYQHRLLSQYKIIKRGFLPDLCVWWEHCIYPSSRQSWCYLYKYYNSHLLYKLVVKKEGGKIPRKVLQPHRWTFTPVSIENIIISGPNICLSFSKCLVLLFYH